MCIFNQHPPGLSFNSDHYTTTAAGTYRWKATYSGDSANHGRGSLHALTTNARYP